MSTRYRLFDELANLTKMVKNSEHNYSKMIQSGELVETHFDYGRGYYDVNIYYLYMGEKHYCRIWFGTIDDGEFGGWNELETKEKAVEMVEKARDIFADMVSCPNFNELNLLFRKIGVYLSNE